MFIIDINFVCPNKAYWMKQVCIYPNKSLSNKIYNQSIYIYLTNIFTSIWQNKMVASIET